MKSLSEKIHKARQHETKGEYKEAIHEYALIAGEFPQNKDTYISLAALYSKINSHLDALFCYEKAISIESDYLSIFNIGNLYYKLNDFKKAAIFFERAKDLNESFIPIRLMLGVSYSKLRNFAAAEFCFQDVLILAPANEVAGIALAMLKYEKGEYVEAEEIANRVLLVNPENNSARKIRSRALLKLNRINESYDETKELIANDEKYTEYCNFMSALPAETFTDKYGTLESKIDFLEKENSKTSDPKKLISLSLCYLLKGDSDSAIDFLYQARKIASPFEE